MHAPSISFCNQRRFSKTRILNLKPEKTSLLRIARLLARRTALDSGGHNRHKQHTGPMGRFVTVCALLLGLIGSASGQLVATGSRPEFPVSNGLPPRLYSLLSPFAHSHSDPSPSSPSRSRCRPMVASRAAGRRRCARSAWSASRTPTIPWAGGAIVSGQLTSLCSPDP